MKNSTKRMPEVTEAFRMHGLLVVVAAPGQGVEN